MTDWYKEKNFTFRLLNLDVNPDFTIWKAWDKRSEIVKDKDGNEMKFPIRDGQLSDDKDKLHEVADLKFMPTKDFKEKFPLLSKNFRYIRTVIVDGKEYNYGFTKSSHGKLIELLDMLKTMKPAQDALGAEFQQSFDSSAPPVSKYSLKITKTGLDKPKVEETKDDGTSGKEKEIMDAIRSVHEDKADETRFVEIMKKNGIEDKRAKELFKDYKG